MMTIKLDFSKLNGLLPAIVQDYETGEVLMLAFMNEEAWESTLATGRATYYSRSRKKLWIKGETSGHVQMVREIRLDCDHDTVLLKDKQVGDAACHTAYKSCFPKKIEDGASRISGKLVFNPEEVYQK
jgi:phosphoribosyl-AMP cyclohydrolase